MHVAYALQRAEELRLDLLHNHMNYLPLPFTPLVSVPLLTTLHGAALLETDSRFLYRRYPHLPYVSISYAERQGAPELRYVANVYNGIDLADFTFVERSGSYLLFLGRISPVKGPDLAIEVAHRTGIPLKLAGPIPPEDREFFETKIRPHVNGRSTRTRSSPRRRSGAPSARADPRAFWARDGRGDGYRHACDRNGQGVCA